MIYLCITPERQDKTNMLMHPLRAGIEKMGEVAQIVVGPPPNDGNPFVVWGQAWLTLDILPQAVRTNRPFWHLDNGFWYPAKGTTHGYYRITYRALSPILLQSPDFKRSRNVVMRRWRKDGKHVLIALPGADFGKALNMDIRGWISRIEERVRAATSRPIKVRPKGSAVSLDKDLQDCWALITHSSNVAVDAVLRGVPVFVEPTSPAAPVGRLDLNIEDPVTPERTHWLSSLMCQQFTLDEMRKGIAYYWMKNVAAQVDGVGTNVVEDACQSPLS